MKNTFKKESQSQNLSFMLESPMPMVVLKMAVPTILSMLVMSVYGLSDMFFVSRLGTSASAAVGIVFSIMTMIQAVGFMLGIGAGSLISRSLGAGNKNDAESVVSVTFFSGILGGVLMMILGYYEVFGRHRNNSSLCKRFFSLHFVGCSGDVLFLCFEYLA